MRTPAACAIVVAAGLLASGCVAEAASYETGPYQEDINPGIVVSGLVDGQSWGCRRFDAVFSGRVVSLPVVFSLDDSAANPSLNFSGLSLADEEPIAVLQDSQLAPGACSPLPGTSTPILMRVELSNYSATIPSLSHPYDPFTRYFVTDLTYSESFDWRVLLQGVPLGSGSIARSVTTPYFLISVEFPGPVPNFNVVTAGQESDQRPTTTAIPFAAFQGGHSFDLTLSVTTAHVVRFHTGGGTTTTTLPPGSACSTISACQAALIGSLPGTEEATDRRSRRAARNLLRLASRVERVLENKAGSRARLDTKARRMLARLLAVAEKANDRGALSVPLGAIEAAVSGLLAHLVPAE